MSQDESGSDEHQPASFPSSSAHSHQSLSAATSTNSLVADTGPTVGHVPDSLDTKIDSLLRDWHHSPDLLYSIHPIDGSFLIWYSFFNIFKIVIFVEFINHFNFN